jgi:hypothetical protein
MEKEGYSPLLTLHAAQDGLHLGDLGGRRGPGLQRAAEVPHHAQQHALGLGDFDLCVD